MPAAALHLSARPEPTANVSAPSDSHSPLTDRCTRRQALLGGAAAALAGGCLPPAPEESVGTEQRVWGRLGRERGQFYKPRAMTLGPDGLLYIVDKTGRIQVFDQDGQFQRMWRTPAVENGKPCGLSFDHQGRLMVADTHYFRVLTYTTKGELLPERTLGGVCGTGPGEFSFVTRAIEDSAGNWYVSEYGTQDRVQKFSPQHEFLMEWGSHGDQPLQFNRPQAMVLDQQDRLWIADSCNHRIQVVDARGERPELVGGWGVEGVGPGQMRYPWDLLLVGPHVYVCELSNHRIQKFTRDGQFVSSWGGPGNGPGQLRQPWSIQRNDAGQLFVLDTYNHRVKRILY